MSHVSSVLKDVKQMLTDCVCVCLLQEFEIELEGSQTLRLLCYEKCYNKSKQNREEADSSDRIIGKGQIPVSLDVTSWLETRYRG